MKGNSIGTGIFFAVLAAAFYSVSVPLSKLLLEYMPSTLMAGFLYLGAGTGMLIVAPPSQVCGGGHARGKADKKRISFRRRHDPSGHRRPHLPAVRAAVCLGGKRVLAQQFRDRRHGDRRARLLSRKDQPAPVAGHPVRHTVLRPALSGGRVRASIFLRLAVCWGVENNCTRKISSKDPLQIVLLKGIFSGTGSLCVGLILGERVMSAWSVFAVMGVGLVAYGLSIFFYVHAQRLLGAARTSAYYAVAPFLGTLLSVAVFRVPPQAPYYVALVLMAAGAWFSSQDKPLFLFLQKKKTHAEQGQPPVEEPPAGKEDVPTETPLSPRQEESTEGELHKKMQKQ